jgi:hypothetical protein
MAMVGECRIIVIPSPGSRMIVKQVWRILLGLAGLLTLNEPGITQLLPGTFPVLANPITWGKTSSPAPGSPADPRTPLPPSPALDSLGIPPGALVIITDDPKKAQTLVPRAVLLTPQEYQKLQNQIDALRKQAQASKPENPSSCKVKGSIEGDLARLKIEYEFTTERPNTLINLGCSRAWATAAKFDGELPWLQPGDDGYTVQIKGAGQHQGTLDVVVPLTMRKGTKGPEQGFDLDLPRPAISLIDTVDLPAGVAEVKLGGRDLHAVARAQTASRLEKTPIVPAEHLELTWKTSGGEPAKGPPVLAADSKISVRITESHILTEVRTNLQVLRGETSTWRLKVPLPEKAELSVKADPLDEARIERIDRSGDAASPIVTVQLKEATSQPFSLTLQVRGTRTSAGLALGPFVILDALSQRGDIEVRASDNLRMYFRQREEVTRQEVTADQRRDQVRAAFSYWNLAFGPAPLQAPLLDIDVESVKGVLETRTSHTVKLAGSSAGAGRLLVTTRIEATPIRTRVDRLTMSLAPEFLLEADAAVRPTSLVEDFTRDLPSRTGMIKLAERQDRSFSVTLEGWYRLAPGQQKLSLELPRLVGWNATGGPASQGPAPTSHARQLLLDRGGQVVVLVPEGFDLLAEQFQKNTEPRLSDAFSPLFSPLRLKAGAREYILRSEKSLMHLELAWKPHRPEVEVESTVDLSLMGRQVRAQQEMILHLGQATLARIVLRVPRELRPTLQVVSGGVVADPSTQPEGDEVSIELTGPLQKEHRLVLSYSQKLQEKRVEAGDSGSSPHAASAPASTRAGFLVVRAVDASTTQTKVRVWCEPDTQASAVGTGWEQTAPEIIEGRSSLPSLVITSRHDEPVSLELTKTAFPVVSAIVERALVRVVLDSSGPWSYRARLWVGQLALRRLRLKLPYRIVRSDIDVRVGDKSVPVNVIDEAGLAASSGQRIQLELEPTLYASGVLLDLRYQVRPEHRPEQNPVSLVLRPPILEDAMIVGRTRWQLILPAGYMALEVGGGAVTERRWGWWKGLLAPRPAAASRELDYWIDSSGRQPIEEDIEPTLVCWQASMAPLPLALVPERLWLFGCSLGLLLLALAFVLARRGGLLFSSVAIIACAGLVAISVYWPGALPMILFGCEPGVLVILAIVAFQWLLNVRYHRQIAALPGFTRLKSGLPAARSESSNGQRPPSTVDVPPKRGSSVSLEVRSS